MIVPTTTPATPFAARWEDDEAEAEAEAEAE